MPDPVFPLAGRIRKVFRERGRYHLVLILSAALLLVGGGVVQYFYTRNLLAKEEERISRMELTSHIDLVVNTLKDVESSMQDNSWSIQRSLVHPDSLFGATRRIVESNPLVDGACIAAVPDYYPEKGRLFETYARREEGGIVEEQIAGPDHDYTQTPDFIRTVRERTDFWGDPYEYGENPVRELTTYSRPIVDMDGRLAAVCGLDLDLTWLSDTLNAHQYYPSSFGFLLTRSGELVAEPRESRVSPVTVQYVTDLLSDSTAVRSVKGHNRINVINFRDPATGQRAFVNFKPMDRDPGWTIVQVAYWDEVLSPVRKMMLRILAMALTCLLFLLFILDLFFRNQRRLQEAGIRQARLGSELRIAGRIQEEMLPKTFPQRDDLSVYGLLMPAKEVGGDLYDYFVRDGKLFFCIGDVSGKSVPAAIVMAVVQSLFRMVSSREDDPARMVGEMNREACRNNESGMFVTFFVGVLDLSSGLLRYCNAGHDHPVIVGASAEELPAIANLPIGTFGDYTYAPQETTLPPGSILFLHTDGVTEAKDVRRNQFTRKRLLETLAAGPREPQALVRKVEESVRRFAEGAEQSDDITMLAIRYDGPAEGLVLDESLTLANNLSQLSSLTGFVRGVTERLGIEDRKAKAMRLALEEMVVNVIDYAYPPGTEGTVTVRSWSDGKSLRFTLSDSGVPFDPTAVPPVDTALPAEDRSLGGLGIHLARSLMDAVRYERVDGTNLLTLEKKL
jgi:sigma-B regulation protein RsbU (phosphoserine phosphatase)